MFIHMCLIRPLDWLVYNLRYLCIDYDFKIKKNRKRIITVILDKSFEIFNIEHVIAVRSKRNNHGWRNGSTGEEVRPGFSAHMAGVLQTHRSGNV